MLFDPRPKERRNELFNREEELSSLERFVKSGSPLILSLGIRRIGKTSLVKVFISESKHPAIYVDVRKLSEYGYSKTGLYSILSREFTRIKGRFAEVVEYLKHIKGVVIGEYGVVFDWKSRELSISSILESMNDYAEDKGVVFLVVIDEAQDLRFLRGYRRLNFRQILAYSYDNLRNVKFILTGSEVGLLYKFLGFDEYSSSLYGRVHDEVVIERFSREKSAEFLEAGFSEAGINVSSEVLEKVVDTLDGIPGWLSFYGYEAVKRGKVDILNEVLVKAVNLALSELRKLTELSKNYRYVLRAVAMGFKSWATIRKAVEAWTGRYLSDETLRRCLVKLANMSILAKEDNEYRFLDPIYKEASKQL